MLEEPLRGLAMGSAAFLGVLVVAMIVTALICRKGQTCYAVNFVSILTVMGYIMWACVYMAQMYPLIKPEYSSSE